MSLSLFPARLLAAVLVAGLWLSSPGWAEPPTQADDPHVSEYVKALKSKNSTVRKQVIVALGEMGAKARSAVPALREALIDSDEGVQTAAAEALEKIDQPRGSANELVKEYNLLRQRYEASRAEAEALAGELKKAAAENDTRLRKAQADADKLKAELQQEKLRSQDKDEQLQKTQDKLLDGLKQLERVATLMDQRAVQVKELEAALKERDKRNLDLAAQVTEMRTRLVAAEVEGKALKERNTQLL
jgi:chromosome segregation ATPase